MAASYGELEIPWSATADVETRMIHVVLQLPEPIVGTGRVLQLSAMAPLVSGKQWRLPALRPQGVSWQEGTAELLVPSSFALERLKTDGCRQSRIAALPAPLAGESIEIQYYRPGATIDVLVCPAARATEGGERHAGGGGRQRHDKLVRRAIDTWTRSAPRRADRSSCRLDDRFGRKLGFQSAGQLGIGRDNAATDAAKRSI